MRKLTKKEEIIMNHYWQRGQMFVRELRELYPEPRPSFNTLSTQVRTLDAAGFLSHEVFGPTYRYYPVVSRDAYRDYALGSVVDKFYGESYMNAVSSLVKKDKISIDELKELVRELEMSK